MKCFACGTEPIGEPWECKCGGTRLPPVRCTPLLSCRVTIGDCSCWLLRVASFVYLHILAWRVLMRGPQDVTDKATIQQDNDQAETSERSER